MSIRVDYLKIRDYVTKVFAKTGLSEEYAVAVADNLVQAEIRGVRSHGLVQVRNYVDKYEQGLYNVAPDIKELKEAQSTLLIDGDNGPGAVIGKYAMKRTIEKAKETGMAVTTVKNATHFGMAAYYAMDALEENMIGFAFTNVSPLVAPYSGYSRELGTNPICIVVPAGNRLPVVFDAATSEAAFNKIFFARTEGIEIPDNWALDNQGRATTNPRDIVDDGGALVPFGEYKGYGLSVMVHILTGILSGSSLSIGEDGNVKEDVSKVGYNFAALDISKFIDIDDFKKMIDDMVDRLKGSARRDENIPIYVPGEPEYNNAQNALETGVEIFDGVAADLRYVGEKAGIDVTLEDCFF